MAEQMNLDDILSDKPVTPPAEAKEAPPAARAEPQTAVPVSSTRRAHQVKERAAREGRERDPETGKFVEAAETKDELAPAAVEAKPEAKAAPEAKPEPVAPPKQDLTEKERAFLRMAEEERHKRQVLELELAKRVAPNAAQQQTAQPTVSFQENPELYFNALFQEQQNTAIKTRVETSEMLARKTYPDYQEKCDKFKELCQLTPGLFQQALVQPDPAEFVYKTAKTHQELADAGSIDELRARLEKEARIKVEAEYKEKEEQRKKEQAALPSSLSNVTSVGTNRPVWGGPTSLDNILKN